MTKKSSQQKVAGLCGDMPASKRYRMLGKSERGVSIIVLDRVGALLCTVAFRYIAISALEKHGCDTDVWGRRERASVSVSVSWLLAARARSPSPSRGRARPWPRPDLTHATLRRNVQRTLLCLVWLTAATHAMSRLRSIHASIHTKRPTSAQSACRVSRVACTLRHLL